MRIKLLVALTAVMGITALIAAAVLSNDGEPAPAASVAQAPALGDATTEGVTVHGEWVIEVRDPDGTLAARYQFSNALTSNGDELLAAFLSRGNSVGLWEIALSAQSDAQPCFDGQTLPFSCHIVESASAASQPQHFKHLTQSSTGGQFILTSFATAAATSDIDHVVTYVSRCAPTIAPSTSCEDIIVSPNPESTEGGRRVSILKWPEGALLNLG